MPFFEKSKTATVNGGTFLDVNGSGNNISVVAGDKRKGEGTELLVKFCLPEAIHDSSARGDLGCHPGTREEYIRSITSWGNGEWNSKEKRAFLMTGPAGAGKSAIARTCAYNIDAAGNLGASFFFYRPSGWNDPKKLIPTIVYQLTTRYPAYRDCVDDIILNNHFVLHKAMDIQFQELLVRPLQKLSDDGHCIKKDTIIIVDGLDECATVDAQIQIIKLVTTSILQQTTPFFWAFFSRPEPPITSAFSSDVVTNISWKLPLTVSRDADGDIEAYIRGGFEIIRAKHSIPNDVAWPIPEDIRLLVSQSAGLFVYPVTAMRYIGTSTSGLEERLRSVLGLGSTSSENPFSALDQLYTLIMMQIPDGVLFDTLSLLYLDQCRQISQPSRFTDASTTHCQFALGLSSTAFYAAISNLYSVLEVTKSRGGVPSQFKFYHKSFTDFLVDETRSQQYFIESSNVLQHCLNKLVQTLAKGVDINDLDSSLVYCMALHYFFDVVTMGDWKLERHILRHVSEIHWGCRHNERYIINLGKFIRKIPRNWRRRIIRPSRKKLSGIYSQILANINPQKYEAEAYTIGEGDKQALIVPRGYNEYLIQRIP